MQLPKHLTTVTTLSKTLALILFIALPILSFLWGMKYQHDMTTNELPIIMYQQKQQQVVLPTITPDDHIGNENSICDLKPYNLKPFNNNYPDLYDIFKSEDIPKDIKKLTAQLVENSKSYQEFKKKYPLATGEAIQLCSYPFRFPPDSKGFRSPLPCVFGPAQEHISELKKDSIIVRYYGQPNDDMAYFPENDPAYNANVDICNSTIFEY